MGDAVGMAELSRFFGIVIRMLSEPGSPHHLPHFHARYQGDYAVFSIQPVELIRGSLPKRARRLVEAWAELHQEELAQSWDLLMNGQKPQAIDPLR